MINDRVWVYREGRPLKINSILSKAMRFGWICVLLPFVFMIISLIADSDTCFTIAHVIVYPAFILALLSFILWAVGRVMFSSVYSMTSVLQWCPVTKNGQLYMMDITHPEFLKAVGEPPIRKDNLKARLLALHRKMITAEFQELMLREDMIEQFGIHVFGITEISQGYFGTRCVCWFGWDEQGDILETFCFYSNLEDPVAFREMLSRYEMKTTQGELLSFGGAIPEGEEESRVYRSMFPVYNEGVDETGSIPPSPAAITDKKGQ